MCCAPVDGAGLAPTIQESDPLLAATAVAAMGGIWERLWTVMGQEIVTTLMRAIEEKLRVPLGASPPPIPAAAASAMGIKLVLKHPEWREQLRANVFYIRKNCVLWDYLYQTPLFP